MSGAGTTVADVRARLAEARSRIRSAGVDPATVAVVAVTKGFGSEAVAAAVGAGLSDIGENYAQELEAKSRVAPAPLRWHFLGAPQRNKIKGLAPIVHLWQGVDRVAVVDELAVRRPGASMLVEVNVGGELSKHGCAPEDAPALVGRAREAGLDVRGLMTVAPAGDSSVARRCFATLAGMAQKLSLRELSMGMSDDFELAVAEGATMIRLGRALFGPRPGPALVGR